MQYFFRKAHIFHEKQKKTRFFKKYVVYYKKGIPENKEVSFPMTFAIVDDSADDREALKKQLLPYLTQNHFSAEITEFENAEEFLLAASSKDLLCRIFRQST